MPINPNIAMGVNPIQFKQSDPYDQFGKQLQLKKLLTGEQDDQTARAAISASDGTPRSILAALVKSGNANPALYSAYQKMAQDAEINASQKGLRDSQTAENMAKVEKAAADQHNAQLQHIQNPADLNGWVQSMYQHPILGPKISKMMPIEKYLSQMPQTPEQFQQWKAEQSMGTSEFLKANKPHFTQEISGDKVNQLQQSGLFGGTPQVTRTTEIKESEAQRLARVRQEEQAKAKLEQDAKQFSLQHGQRQKFHDEKLGADKAAVGKIEWKQDTDGSWVALPKEVKDGTPVTPIRTTLPGKKEVQSGHAIDIINEARGLVDQATGSFVGAGVDFAGRTVGASTGGAIATGKLKALEGSLMMAQPRMEGPQSDKDVALYRQMAGQIGDPTVQREVKLGALDEIEKLHRKYAPNAPGAAPTQPKPPKPGGGPKAGTIENGYRFKGGNPADKSNWEKM